MAATAYSVALLGGARLPAVPRSALLPRRSSVCPLRLQTGKRLSITIHYSVGCCTTSWWVGNNLAPAFADSPRLSLLRAKAASEDTASASGDELIEDLKAKVRRMLLHSTHLN
jgi:hypothetical protein